MIDCYRRPGKRWLYARMIIGTLFRCNENEKAENLIPVAIPVVYKDAPEGNGTGASYIFLGRGTSNRNTSLHRDGLLIVHVLM